MKKVLGIALICAFTMISNVLYAQGTISGKVIDKKSNSPVEYANVAILKASDSSLANGSITGGNGGFNISKLPYGKYILRVTFMGYSTYFHPTPIVLSSSNPSLNVGKIMLAPASNIMEEVQITAERTMMEYQLDKRVVNVDKNIVASGGTATDILENVPSVAIDNDGNVTLRGSTNVKVLINDRPYELMSSDLESLLEQIPASTVENVEVITNPSAKYDPEGMSGIINIKLKDKTAGALGLNGVANINFGTPLGFLFSSYPKDYLPAIISTSMGSINLNYTTEKYSLMFSADGGIRSHGHKGSSDVERLRNGEAWSHDSLESFSVGSNKMGSMKLGAEYYFNSKNTLLFSYQLRGGVRGRESVINSADVLRNGYLDYFQTDTNHSNNINHTFNLNYTKRFDEKDRLLTFNTTFNMRHVWGEGIQEQNYFGNAIWDNYYLRESSQNNHNKTLNIQLNYVHPFGDKWKLETGYEGRAMWARPTSDFYRTEWEDSTVLARYFDSISSTQYEYNQQIHAVYATLGGKLSDNLSIQGGLRGEYSAVNGHDVRHPNTDPVSKTYWKVYPTLHLSYQINKDQSVQLSYSRRVRRPYMWDMNPYIEVTQGQELHFGNPNLDPEFTNSFEVSYNLGIKSVNIFTSAYYRQTNNMMTRYGYVWDEESAERYSWWLTYNPEYYGYWASTWQNLNKGTNYGLEFIVDWQVNKWWKMNVSFNLYENIIEGTELLDNTDRKAFRASGKFSSYMNLPKDWTIQLSGQYRAPFMDLQTDMMASYWADLAVKKDVFNRRGTLNVRVGDFLCTGGFGHTTHNEQLNRVSTSKRISPTISVGFSYKINNGLRSQRKDNQEMDYEGDGEY